MAEAALLAGVSVNSIDCNLDICCMPSELLGPQAQRIPMTWLKVCWLKFDKHAISMPEMLPT